MRSSMSNTEMPEDPLRLAHQLLDAVLAAGVELGAGVVLGRLAARLMRARHAHWSWCVVALGPITLMRHVLGAGALVLACAALTAALRGRRWHREDLTTGGDLATVAALRSSPLGAVLSALRGLTGDLPLRDRGERRLTIGHDERRRAVRVPFAADRSGTHTLVVGATGSGKTVTQTAMAVAAIERGMGVIVIDPKGDAAMSRRLERAAAHAGRSFGEWTPAGDCVYNPYASGSETEIADKVLAAEPFTEPHYLRQAQRYLGHAVRALRLAAREISLREIVETLEPERLELVARSLAEEESAPIFAYLDSLTARQQRDLAGVRDRVAILVESDVGPWLDPAAGRAPRIALPDAVRGRSVVYFRLEADSRPLLSKMLGAAIVQDLQTTVAGLQGRAVPTAVVIDEFSAVAAEQVVRLFGRARSAGFSLVLGTQEISDLRLPGRERLLEQVMGNLSLLVAHRQVVPASAETIAAVAGREGAWRVSCRSDGTTTRTRTTQPILDATQIMGLGRGWAAVIPLGGNARARITRIRRTHERG